MAETNIDNIYSIAELLELYDKIQMAKDYARKKAPYHFNAVLNAGPLEPGVSKILAGFFWQKTNEEYLILKSFVRRFFGEELASQINTPIILAEKTVKDDKRIDILVYEKDKYAIVLENKYWDAVDQPNQLANYIEALMEGDFNFDKNKIYIAFLPPTKNHNPSLNSWISKETGESYKEEFQERFRLIDFKEDILQWLEDSQEVNEMCKDEYFAPSLFLFIDFLRRSLRIDNIDNMEQVEIDKVLNEQLDLSDNAIANADKMIAKLAKIDEVVRQITVLRKETTSKIFQEWLENMHRDYQYTIFDDRTDAHLNIGVNVPYMGIQEFFSVFIWNYQNGNTQSVGICLTKEGEPYRKKIEPKVRELVRKKKGFLKGQGWLFYKFVSYEEAYPLLQELVRELPNI